MRIDKDRPIAGLPAEQVRRFMRSAAGSIIRPATVTDVLGFCESDSRRVLRRLQQEGFVVPKSGYWEATAKGHALTMATAAKPLRRNTAEKLIADVVGRAGMINLSNDFAYRVQRLAVFGSVEAGASRPNDVDIACKLVARFEGEKQDAVERERQLNKGRFANTTEWAAWPKLEVLKTLKARSRGLSIQEFSDWNFPKENCRDVFSDTR